MAALAVIFFALLGMILLRKGATEPTTAKINEGLLVLPVRIRVRTEPNAKAKKAPAIAHQAGASMSAGNMMSLPSAAACSSGVSW